MLKLILFSVIALTHIQKFCAALRISYEDEESVKFIYPHQNSPNYLIHSKSLNLSCQTKEPMEWIYTGGGSPSKVIETTKRVEDGFISQLKFDISSNKSKDYSHHTGTYSCRSLQNSTHQASVYLYFPGHGDKLFLHGVDSISTPEILHLPDCTEVPENCSQFVIPCLPTDPRVNVSLYWKTLKKKLELLKDVEFDSKIGFNLSNANLSLLVGEYKCIAETAVRENKTFFVYPAKFVKPIPDESNVYVGKVLNLTCEFNEPVFIKEIESYSQAYDEDEVIDDEIEETTEKIPLNKHLANYVDEKPIPGSYGEFQCLTDNDLKMVLHSWKYFVIGKEADEKSGIKYSKSKKSFRCRSKTNQDGMLSFVHCETPSECAINRVCLEKSNNCRGYKNPQKKPYNHCKTSQNICTEVLHYGGSGFVRCTGEGIDQIKKFNQFGFKKGMTNDKSTLNLTLSLVNDTRIFKAKLKMSHFNYVHGLKWSLKFVNENGSQELFVEPESERIVDQDLMEYSFKILTTINPLELTCQIPQRQSMDWTTITVSFPKSSSNDDVKTVILDDVVGTTMTSLDNGNDGGSMVEGSEYKI